MRVVYVSHNGIGTALVRSQVLPYLRRLQRAGVACHLITYERGRAHVPDGDLGLADWSPIQAGRGSSLPAKLLDIVRGARAVVRSSRGATLVHARSYVPAAVAWLAGRVTRTPFLFDMRGFLPDEYVDAGNWRRDELRYRLLRSAERLLLRDAAEVVVLTRTAAERLRSEARFAGAVGPKAVTVIPCAVELDRFMPTERRAAVPTLVYSGSVGMWYLLPQMLEVFRQARKHLPQMRFLILNRDDRELIERAVATLGVPNVDIRAADFAEMPAQLAAAHVGIALLRHAPSKSGSSPIKVAEYLACGLPVVVNVGLGDTDTLVRRYGAGHVVLAEKGEALDEAARAVARLSTDEGARTRARALAEAEYDADDAASRYAASYARIGQIHRA